MCSQKVKVVSQPTENSSSSTPQKAWWGCPTSYCPVAPSSSSLTQATCLDNLHLTRDIAWHLRLTGSSARFSPGFCHQSVKLLSVWDIWWHRWRCHFCLKCGCVNGIQDLKSSRICQNFCASEAGCERPLAVVRSQSAQLSSPNRIVLTREWTPQLSWKETLFSTGRKGVGCCLVSWWVFFRESSFKVITLTSI